MVALLTALFLTAPLTHLRAQSFGELHARLLPKEAVEVTLHDGKRVRGIVTAIESSFLGLEVPGRALEVGSAEVNRIETARGDSLVNGALIGAGTGLALGLIPDYYDDCEECHDSLYASAAIGAGIGLLVDAVRKTRRVVYRAPAEFSSSVGFTIGRESVGLQATIRW